MSLDASRKNPGGGAPQVERVVTAAPTGFAICFRAEIPIRDSTCRRKETSIPDQNVSAAQPASAVADRGLWRGLHPGMAQASLGVVLLFILFTVLDVERAGAVFSRINTWITTSLNWYYVGFMCAALAVSVYLAISPHGAVRLGRDDERPEFRTFSWLAMLFSAGLGIGMLFFSIVEPLFYFDTAQASGYPNNPHADRAGVVALERERAIHAMRITFLHWGLHAWAVFVIVGLCLAYFSYRKNLPLTLRSALYPVIGDRIHGPIGHAVDLLAIFGTVFGLATSLGLGAQQMARGLNVLFDIDPGRLTQLGLIAVISAAATISVVSGLRRGIRILSEWNIYCTLVLLGFFVLFSPIPWLAGFVGSAVADYAWHVLPAGLWIADTAEGLAWQSDWTIFFWGWWIAWAPFVGTFIARISRGRTLREFILGVVFVPTSFCILWICLLGGNAIYLELNAADGVGTAGIIQLVRESNYEAALYGTIAQLSHADWLTWGVSALVTLMLGTWFVTSSDSGTLVINTMLSMGDDDPPRLFRIVWGLGIGLVAAVLLQAGGLQALQTASIAGALPVSIVMLLMSYGLFVSLAKDAAARRKDAARRARKS